MFNGEKKTLFTRADLKKADPESLKKLAIFLHLKTDDMKHKQRAKLIYWLLTRRNHYE